MAVQRDRNDDPRRLKAPPTEYAGQWVAGDKDRQNIVAHGEDIEEVRAAALSAGVRGTVLQKLPPIDVIRVPPVFQSKANDAT
ncbi:MAG: hypothetical protein HYS13_05390 [Planctomycetia bacterium]|nr:hypothetical protein [Planctomycetia bacterium]